MSKPWFKDSGISKRELRLSNAMRFVWEQHVYWTRMTINSIAFNTPDLDANTERLLRNATDMGILLEPFYGSLVAQRFSNLIRDHLVIAAELVQAAKAGNQRAVADAKRRWFANGEEIVNFLSRINPFISEETFRELFFEHLNLTIQEAELILQGKFSASIAVFEKIEAGALEMADIITKAIVRQFPRKFPLT